MKPVLLQSRRRGTPKRTSRILRFGPPPANTLAVSQSAAGFYRVADPTLARYELHVGVDASPDFGGSPEATFTTLPQTLGDVLRAYFAAVLDDTPAFYYRLGDATTAAADSSGNANAGTYSGAYTQGQSGAIAGNADTAVKFAGGMVKSNAYVMNAPAASMEAWVYLTAAPTGNDAVLCLQNGIGSGVEDHVLSVNSSAEPVWFIYDGTAKNLTGAALSLNGWHHLVGTVGGGTQCLYIDGALVGSQACGAAYAAYTVANVFVGSDGSSPFAGIVDEAAGYTFALTATRVLAHYTAGVGRHVYHLVLRQRDAWNLCSQNVNETILDISAAGALNPTPPSPPENFTASPAAAGGIQVSAEYLPDLDGENAADTFLLFLTSDGSTPNPATTPTATASVNNADGIAKFSYLAGPFAEATVVKVLVRMRITGSPNRDSTNTAPVSATATLLGPSAPTGIATLGEIAE